MDTSQYPALPVYAMFATGLCLFMMTLDGVGGTFRAKSKTTPNPEDTSTTSKGAQFAAEDPESVARAMRAWRNGFANIVPHLFIAFLYVLTGASAKNATIYMGVFAGARLLHSIVYLAGKQPWRTIFFVVGQLATVGLGVQVIMYFRK